MMQEAHDRIYLSKRFLLAAGWRRAWRNKAGGNRLYGSCCRVQMRHGLVCMRVVAAGWGEEKILPELQFIPFLSLCG